METIEQKKRRLIGKQYLPVYLTELNKLIKNVVVADDLLSIQDSDNIYSTVFSDEPIDRFTTSFEKKDRLKILFESIESAESLKYILFTAYSHECGAIRIGSLVNFNVDFDFDDEHSGLIILISNNLLQKILLDFYEEGGERYIDVEIYRK